jgi:hypothetical protein
LIHSDSKLVRLYICHELACAFFSFIATNHGFEYAAHTAILERHSLSLETKALVLTTFFHHNTGGSCVTLQKSSKSTVRAEEKACDDRGCSCIVRLYSMIHDYVAYMPQTTTRATKSGVQPGLPKCTLPFGQQASA